MNKPRVLIVDDEENIRLTLSRALSELPVETDTAAGGQEALDKVAQNGFSLVLLDLQMPGIDGMEVLQTLRDQRPDVHVIILTGYGTVESAVEAMKLGAIEFLRKPFVPQEIRALVSRVLDRQKLLESDAHDYAACFELAKRCLSERQADAAITHLKKAIGIDPARPEAYNLLGAIHELRGQRQPASSNYRVAWDVDATYEPAQKNLHRLTSPHPSSAPIVLGELRTARK